MRPSRQCSGWHGLAALLLAVLTACGGGSKPELGEIGNVEGFIGLVAAEEPRAVLIARDLLSAGGTAADAAAGLYFALSVTYPSAASLGGGGVCVAYDKKTNKGDALEFLPRAPAAPGPVAIPGNVRGMAALQARFGRLRWEQVLAPAEQLARFGHALSRASVQAAEAAGPAVQQNPALAPLLADAGGRPLAEGETLRQIGLGATIGRLRTAGSADFYGGQLARSLLRDLAAVGSTITPEELRQMAAVWKPPVTFVHNNVTMMLPPPPAGGEIVRQLWQATVTDGGWLGSDQVARERLVQALNAAYGEVPGGAPVGGAASTGFAVADKDGNAVACVVTMGRPYGAGLMASNAGILLAPPQGEADVGRFLVALVGANLNVKQLFAAGSASGGAPAPAALVEVLSGVIAGEQPLDRAMAAPRLFRAGPQAVVLYEPNVAPALLSDLQRQGLPLAEVSRLGQVNLLYCSNALPREPETCRVRTDRRGYGLSVGEF